MGNPGKISLDKLLNLTGTKPEYTAEEREITELYRKAGEKEKPSIQPDLDMIGVNDPKFLK